MKQFPIFSLSVSVNLMITNELLAHQSKCLQKDSVEIFLLRSKVNMKKNMDALRLVDFTISLRTTIQAPKKTYRKTKQKNYSL